MGSGGSLEKYKNMVIPHHNIDDLNTQSQASYKQNKIPLYPEENIKSTIAPQYSRSPNLSDIISTIQHASRDKSGIVLHRWGSRQEVQRLWRPSTHVSIYPQASFANAHGTHNFKGETHVGYVREPGAQDIRAQCILHTRRLAIATPAMGGLVMRLGMWDLLRMARFMVLPRSIEPFLWFLESCYAEVGSR